MYDQLIDEAVDVLKRGGLIAFPTETSYGLGGDPRSSLAVDKIFKLKKRDENKTLPLIAASTEQVNQFASLTEVERDLTNKYWPGPLNAYSAPRGRAINRSFKK